MDLRWSFIVPQTHGVDVPAETTPSVSERPRKKSRLQTPNERKGTYEKRSNHCCLVTDSCRSSFSTMGRIRSHLSSNCRDPLFYEHTRNFNGTKGTSCSHRGKVHKEISWNWSVRSNHDTAEITLQDDVVIFSKQVNNEPRDRFRSIMCFTQPT